ncbi:MAG: DNA polymerase domain-containing protein [Promethearchaeota archaeon]
MEPEKKELEFVLLDLDYLRIGSSTDKRPLLRLFGQLTDRKNIIVQISDFFPYFYTSATETDLLRLKDSFFHEWVIKTETTTKSVYHGGKAFSLTKVTGKRPWEVPKLRKIISKHKYEVYEADIPFVKRYLLSSKIRGLRRVKVRGTIQKTEDITIIDAFYKDVIPVDEESQDDWRPIVLSFDIEVDHEEETVQQLLSETRKRITAISITWGQFDKKFETRPLILKEDSDKAEKSLILNFLKSIDKLNPAVLVTFNGNFFDFPYLLKRMEKLGISPVQFSVTKENPAYYHENIRAYRCLGRLVVDLMPKTWRVHVLGRKDLGSVAEHLLGVGKVKYDVPLGVLWRQGLEKKSKFDLFRSYVAKDSELTYRLYWALGVSEWLEVIRLTGYHPPDGVTATERMCGEFELMRECVQADVLIPSHPDVGEEKRRRKERRENPHEAGLVLDPEESIVEGVIITDFKSLYPSIVIAYNIGGETLQTDKTDPFEMFTPDPETCLARMLRKALDARWAVLEKISDSSDELEKDLLMKRQRAYKLLANSLIGAFVFIRSRFFSLKVGGAITAIGRWHLDQIKEWVNEYTTTSAKVIYGDTDSAFIQLLDPTPIINLYESNDNNHEKLRKNALKTAFQLIKHINDQLRSPMQLELEDIAYRIAFVPGRKKAYSYVSASTSNLHIRGFEAVRSDWSKMAQDIQRDVLNAILREKNTEEGQKKAEIIVLETAVNLLKAPIYEIKDFIIIKSSIKQPSEYKSPTPAVGAFIHFCKMKKQKAEKTWKDYDRFPYVITPGNGPLYKRARHPDYAEKIDRTHYVDEILRAATRFGIKLTLNDVKRYGGFGLGKYLQKTSSGWEWRLDKFQNDSN